MRVKEKIEVINAAELDYRALNERIRQCGSARINACLGQRFIASGMREGEIEIHGTPGNALGAYLAGASITVYGNAQDAVGDTMYNRSRRHRRCRGICDARRRDNRSR